MASNTEKELILITGGTNGIGLATVEYIASASPKYHVIIGARNLSKGEAVLKDVQAKSGIKGTVSVVQIDVTDDSSIQTAAKKVEQDFGRLDILINNAGISPEREEQWPSRKMLQNVFDTNVFGPNIVTENFVPVLKKSSSPRIINVTSVMGSISSISDHSAPYSGIRIPSYRASKSALNMLTAYQYFQLKPEGFKVWAFCPGYVVTDLAEDREERIKMGVDSAETSAKGLLEIVEGQRDDHVGCFIGRNGAKYEW